MNWIAEMSQSTIECVYGHKSDALQCMLTIILRKRSSLSNGGLNNTVVIVCRPANVPGAFDTAAFRPPHSLTLSTLKLYFAQHPHEHQRRVIDTKLDELQRVTQAVPHLGLTTADGRLSFGQVSVTEQEGNSILQQLLQELVRLSGRYDIAMVVMSRYGVQFHNCIVLIELCSAMSPRSVYIVNYHGTYCLFWRMLLRPLCFHNLTTEIARRNAVTG